MRVDRPESLRPGDVFAWLKPPHWKRPNTGHVGFLVSAARPHPEYAGVWLMKIADATSIPHQGDSRDKDGEGGYGTGVIAFQFEPDGQAVGYGWYGARQPPKSFVPTRVVFGRVRR